MQCTLINVDGSSTKYGYNLWQTTKYAFSKSLDSLQLAENFCDSKIIKFYKLLMIVLYTYSKKW